MLNELCRRYLESDEGPSFVNVPLFEYSSIRSIWFFTKLLQAPKTSSCICVMACRYSKIIHDDVLCYSSGRYLQSQQQQQAAAGAVVSSSSISFQGNQTAQHTNQHPYNATENMISTFKTADSLLIQALYIDPI